MQTVKLNTPELVKAAKMLRTANAMLAEAKKIADSAKENIKRILKDERGIDVTTLHIGEIVSVDKVLLIEIGKQCRFDESGFQLVQPDMYAKWKKDFPTVKIKSLV